MKWFHSITISIFIKPEEDYKSLKERFIQIFPFSLADSKMQIKETTATSFEDRILRILELKLTKEALINQLMKSILNKLSAEDKNLILKQITTRVDAECNFFFRIGKNELLSSGNYVIVEDGNCFHFKCYVAAYPQNREKAIEIASKFLSLKDASN